MNNTITTWIEILFWLSLFLVFYTTWDTEYCFTCWSN